MVGFARIVCVCVGIWEIVNVVLDIDSDIKIIYVDPVVSDSAGVV